MFEQRVIIVERNNSATLELVDQLQFLCVGAFGDSVDFGSPLSPAQNDHGVDEHGNERKQHAGHQQRWTWVWELLDA